MQKTADTKNLKIINSFLDENNYFTKYGDNALLLYTLTLRFPDLDMDSAAEFLTDGHNDKKIDLVYIDMETKTAIIAQSYFSKTEISNEKSAKSSKASDLNAGISWLLNSTEESLPDQIRAAAIQLRTAIKEKSINQIEIWYVHNLNESKQCQKELDAACDTAKVSLKSNYSNSDVSSISIIPNEIGRQTLSEFYNSAHNIIAVTDDFKIPVSGGFESYSRSTNTTADVRWKTFMTSISLDFLYKSYSTYRDKLFSANVREYLGSRNGSSNINNGIKESAREAPEDFLIYNNGITILTNSYSYDNNNKILELHGISIINGAQTTGAIGSIKDEPKTGKIFARIVQINKKDILKNVIEYNNKQNAMNPADFRSTDRIQKKLKKAFESIGFADYFGGRRGGNGDAIQRNSKNINNYTIAKSLTAYMGNPIVAYQSSKRIWEDNTIYNTIFNDDSSVENMLFVYVLYMALNQRKDELKNNLQSDNSDSLNKNDEKILEMMQIRGSFWLIIAAISETLPYILDNKVTNKQFIHFKKLNSLEDGVKMWRPIVDFELSLAPKYLTPVLKKGLKKKQDAKEAIQDFTDNINSLNILVKSTTITKFNDKISVTRP